MCVVLRGRGMWEYRFTGGQRSFSRNVVRTVLHVSLRVRGNGQHAVCGGLLGGYNLTLHWNCIKEQASSRFAHRLAASSFHSRHGCGRGGGAGGRAGRG